MWNGQSVGVVFPAYNEAQNIASAVAEFRDLAGADQSRRALPTRDRERRKEPLAALRQ